MAPRAFCRGVRLNAYEVQAFYDANPGETDCIASGWRSSRDFGQMAVRPLGRSLRAQADQDRSERTDPGHRRSLPAQIFDHSPAGTIVNTITPPCGANKPKRARTAPIPLPGHALTQNFAAPR